jgi:hypothetical protein
MLSLICSSGLLWNSVQNRPLQNLSPGALLLFSFLISSSSLSLSLSLLSVLGWSQCVWLGEKKVYKRVDNNLYTSVHADALLKCVRTSISFANQASGLDGCSVLSS